MHRQIRLLLAVIFILPFIVAAPQAPATAHSGITVDGDCSEWELDISDPSWLVHTDFTMSVPSGVEWAYKGLAGDYRTDLGISGNNDLVAMRVTGDETYLYLCVQMDDISDLSQPNVAINIDTDNDGSDTALNWIGNFSKGGSSYPLLDPQHDGERQINMHYTGATSFDVASKDNLEFYADNGTNWYTLDNNVTAASVTGDAIEARVEWSALGCGAGPCNDLLLSVTTYRNVTGWNNDGDTTADISTTYGDGIDVLGGDPGGAENAFFRDFSDGMIDQETTISFDTPTAVQLMEVRASGRSVSPLMLASALLLSILTVLLSFAITRRRSA